MAQVFTWRTQLPVDIRDDSRNLHHTTLLHILKSCDSVTVHSLAGLLLEMGRTDSPVDVNCAVVVFLVEGSTKQVLGPDIRVTEASGPWVAHHLHEVCERHFGVKFEEEGLAVVDVKLLGEDRGEKVPVLVSV